MDFGTASPTRCRASGSARRTPGTRSSGSTRSPRVARQQLERVREAYAELAAVSPAVAENVRSVMADQERMLQPQRLKAISVERRVG